MWFKSMWEPAKTDEEYKAVLKMRRKVLLVPAIAGAVSIAASIFLLKSGAREFLAGLYMGLGCGILAAAAVCFLRIRSILKDEEKIRTHRLKETDERNIQVTLKAHNTAGVMLIMTGYAILLASGFFSMEVFWTVWALLMLYFAFFIIGRMVYERKM